MTRLIKLGAFAALIGGGLRVLSSFIPYDPASAWQELLFGVIDIGLLFGLIALYLRHADQLGTSGLACFAIALTGLASIVGPDAHAFGVDWYLAGSILFLISLAGLAALMLRCGIARPAAACWIAALLCAMVVPLDISPLFFAASGGLLGLGFVLAGRVLMHGAGAARPSGVSARTNQPKHKRSHLSNTVRFACFNKNIS